MGLARYGGQYEKRIDPRGRSYFWATNDPAPPPSEIETDLSALKRGCVTLTPLHFNLTEGKVLAEMSSWQWQFASDQWQATETFSTRARSER